MSLQQLQDFKHWHLGHPRGHTVETAVADGVLCAWVMGWMALPVMVVLQEWAWLPLSLLSHLLPMCYWSLRRHLHRSGRLRCDWLHTVQRRAPTR